MIDWLMYGSIAVVIARIGAASANNGNAQQLLNQAPGQQQQTINQGPITNSSQQVHQFSSLS